MPDPVLPPSVYQGMGWPDPGGAAFQPPTSLGPPQEWGGLPPSIPQGMGWAPPPPDAAPPDTGPPPAPVALPSTQGQQPAPAPGPREYQVPPTAFGAGASVPPPGAKPATPTPGAQPAGPRTFDQRMDNVERREAANETEARAAVTAGVDAERGKNADDLAAFGAYNKQIADNAANRKAEQEQWNTIYAKNEATNEADRQAVASWKFNRNKFMDDLGIGGRVSWGIATVLAGIGNALMRNNGPNPVAQQLQQDIHDANEAQFKERDAAVQKLGIDRQTGLDAQQYHALRQAELDKADGLAQTVLAKKFEEAAVRSADPMAQARGMDAAAKIGANATALLQSNAQVRSQHELEQAKVGIEGGQLAETRRHNKFEEGFQVYKENQEADLKAAALAAKNSGKLSEEESKRAIFIPGPDGRPIPATRKDGTVVLAADPGDAGKIRRQVASTATYNALIGKMTRGIDDHGGESDWWHSKDWQDMKTDYKAAVAELHEAYGIQSFREPTIEFFNNMTAAGLDPTSFNKMRDNASEALQNSNRNIQLKMNGLLGAQGYDREPVAWENTTNAPAPTQTEQEKWLNRGLLNPHRGFDKLPGVLATELGNFSPRGQLGPNETVDTRLKQAGEILPTVRQQMETLGAALNSPDMTVRIWSRQWLDKLSNQSESPETAALAQQLLERGQAQQIGQETRTTEATRGSAGAPR